MAENKNTTKTTTITVKKAAAPSVNLKKAQCRDNSDVQYSEFHDCTLNGVTYRVWSAFLGKEDAAHHLSNLMLRSLESGEEVGEIVDWREIEIDRIIRETLEVARLAKQNDTQTDDESEDETEEQTMSM